ncbi:MAG: UDP-N-acetyl glucosamine 2-epimerase [Chloroflexi bacterium]|nr:UDP-N-acetyl glucosamine 2-epimerase [Chloroflexota bacterium]
MVKKGNILFIGGSLNQTTMMHKISMHFPDYNCYFTPFYSDGIIDILVQRGLLDFTILGGQFRQSTVQYLRENNLRIDWRGINNDYDLVFTCQDLLIPKNIRNKKIVLVQEGMTDPETIFYHFVKMFDLPRWLAGTSTTGLSDAYDLFCVASEGYRELFIEKGVKSQKIKVTGIPNFDNVAELRNNNFPYKNYVLVATSDFRETLKFENRREFIRRALHIANGRQLIFKLHPNENHFRASNEIKEIAPEALIFTGGNVGHMVANCDTFITRYSSVVYLAIALNKVVYSDYDNEWLRKMCPIQNNGTSAARIAEESRSLLLSKSSTSPLKSPA